MTRGAAPDHLNEEELAAACSLLVSRRPELASLLAPLEEEHVDAAARLQLRGKALRFRWRPHNVPRTGELEWLRDRELELARHYTARHHPEAPAAWQRYLRAERLLMLDEFGEPISA